jgi:hypothetical protein
MERDPSGDSFAAIQAPETGTIWVPKRIAAPAHHGAEDAFNYGLMTGIENSATLRLGVILL